MQGALFCPPQCPKGTPVLCPHQFFLFLDNGHSQLLSTCSLLLPCLSLRESSWLCHGNLPRTQPLPSPALVNTIASGWSLAARPSERPLSLPLGTVCSFWLTPQCSQGGPLALCTGVASAWNTLPLSQGVPFRTICWSPTLRGPPSAALFRFCSVIGSCHVLRFPFSVLIPAHCLSSPLECESHEVRCGPCCLQHTRNGI